MEQFYLIFFCNTENNVYAVFLYRNIFHVAPVCALRHAIPYLTLPLGNVPFQCITFSSFLLS